MSSSAVAAEESERPGKSCRLPDFRTRLLVPAREGRWAAIGLHNGKTITVIFAALGQEAVSVISMRPASDWEKELI